MHGRRSAAGWAAERHATMRPEYRELRTDRLLLRQPREDDASAVFEAFGADPEVTRYLAWPRHRSIADAEAGLTARLEWSRRPLIGRSGAV